MSTAGRASGAHVLMLVENMSVPSDRRVWAEARALRDAGHRVSVVSPTGRGRDTERQVEVDGIAVHRFPPREATGGPWGYLREYANALRHLRRIARRAHAVAPVDVVHVCNPPDIVVFAVGSLRRGGARVVFDHHDLVPELFEARFGRRGGLLYAAAKRFERATFVRADVVVAPNETYRQIAVERGGKSPDDVFVVRMAPDTERFSPGGADESLRCGKPHLLAYVGTMGPQDGVDLAVRALGSLREIRQDWHAILAGEGDAAGEARALVEALDLGANVEFPGFVDDREIVRLLRSADVCIAPEPRNALNEASTMIKIVEYLAFAKPVVAFDLGEARASAGAAAAYAPEDTPEALAAEIDRLLDDPALRERMGAEGRRRVTGELSWERSEASLLAAYERVLSVRKT
jgi:glycosyltransferase involved in cell wall biosynthesis